MKQSSRNSQADLAFGSITTILQNIYDKTSSGNEFLDSITNTLNNISNKIDNKLDSVVSYLKNISINLSSDKKKKSLDIQSTEFVDDSSNITNDFLSKIHLGIVVLNNTLDSINSSIKKGFLFNVEFTGDNFVDVIKILTQRVNEKTYIMFEKLLHAYEKLISKDNDNLLKEFAENVGSLGKSLSLVNKIVWALPFGLSLIAISLKILHPQLKKIILPFRALSRMLLYLTLPTFWIGSLVMVTFLKALKSTIKGMDKDTPTFKNLAIGIGLLVGSLSLMMFVSFATLGKALIFLVALSQVLKLFDKQKTEQKALSGLTSGEASKKVTGGDKKTTTGGLIGLAVGLSLFILSLTLVDLVSWGPVLRMVTFLAAIGGTMFFLNKINPKESIGKQLIMFGLSISIFVISLLAITEVPWDAVFKLIVFISAIGLTIAGTQFLINKIGGATPGAPKGMFGFAIGITILVLSIHAIDELSWVGTAKMILFILALGAAITLPGLISKGKSDKGGMFGFAIGLAIIILTIHAAKEVDWVPSFYIVGFVVAMGLAMKLIDVKGGQAMLKLSGALIAMTAAVYLISLTNITLEQILMFSVAIYVFMGLSVLASAAKSEILKGSLAILVLSGATLASAFMISTALSLKYDFVNLILFLAVITILTLTYVGLTFVAPVALPGVGMVLAIAIASVAITIPLMIIQSLTYDNVPKFVDTLSYLTFEFFKMLPAAIGGIVTAFLLIPIGGAAIITGTALMLISFLKIDNAKVKSYASALSEVVNTMNSFGIFSLGKSVIKAGMLMPIIAAMTLAAGGLKIIGELNVDESKIDNFGIVLKKFIQVSKDEISNASKALKDLQPGLESLALIVNIGATMVDLVSAFASGTYNSYKVDNNGKVVIDKVHPLNDDAYEAAGQNFGKLLNGLLKPISTMSSDAKEWDFDGVKVQNPFAASGGSGWKQMAAVQRITDIGNAYSAIIDVIANFGSLDIAREDEALAKFRAGFNGAITQVIESFNQLSEMKQLPKIDLVIQNISNFGKAFSFFDTEKMEKISTNLTDIIGIVSNTDWDLLNKEYGKVNSVYLSILDTKWDLHNKRLSAASKHYQKIGKQYEIIAKNINSIDIDKAIALEKSLKLLTDMKANENLEKVVDKLKELIGLIKEEQDKQQQLLVVKEQAKIKQQEEEKEKITKLSEGKTTPSTVQEKTAVVLGSIEALLDDIKSATQATESTLKMGKIKVSVQNNESNIY